MPKVVTQDPAASKSHDLDNPFHDSKAQSPRRLNEALWDLHETKQSNCRENGLNVDFCLEVGSCPGNAKWTQS